MEDMISTVEIGHDEKLCTRGGKNWIERGHWPAVGPGPEGGGDLDTEEIAEIATKVEAADRIHLCWVCVGDGCRTCGKTGRVTSEQILNELIDADVEDIYDRPGPEDEESVEFGSEFVTQADFDCNQYQPDLDEFPY